MKNNHTIRLLVVDDDWRFCRAVAEAENAVQLAQAPFDLFLIDQRLEDYEIDGIALARRLLSNSPNSGAIVLTGFASVEDGLRALQAGADDYIAKTRNWDTLFKELGLRIKVLVENREMRRRRIQELESLNQILEATMGIESEADLAAVLHSVVEQTHRALPGVDVITVYYIDRETNAAMLGGAIGVNNPSIIESMSPDSDSVVRRALHMNQPHYAPDSLKDSLVQGNFVEREGIKSTAVFPLHYGPARVGCMFFNYRTPQTFNEDHKHELTIFARQAALAIHKAVLYDETRRRQQRFETVAQIAPIISATLDPEEVVRAILNEVRKVVPGARQACMLHFEPDSGDLVFAKSSFEFYHIDVEKEKTRTRLSAAETSVAMRVARTGQAENVPDVQAHDDYLRVVSSTRSELCVPIKAEGEMLGVLVLERDRVSAFTYEDQRLLEALADQMAIALKKAQEHEQLLKTQDDLAANSAIAWMGLFGSNWSHTVNQRTFEIETKVYLLREALSSMRVSPKMMTWLTEIEEASKQIKRLPIAGRLSAAPGQSNTTLALDQTLAKHVQAWCVKRPDVKLKLDLNCGHVHVPIEEGWFEIPLEKLVSNALKAMPGPGQLTVRSLCQGAHAEVQVQDTGPGIPDSIRDILFKRPVPQASAQEGSGLGLLIARKVLTAHGGDLELMPGKPGEGASFVFHLPIAQGGQRGG